MATINLGRVKPVFRGAYAGGTAYVVDDIVTSGNETFICIQASTGNATSNASYWTKLAAKGTDGTDVGTTLTTQGDILYRDGSGLQRLAAGTSGQFLKTQGSGANVTWADAGGGLTSTQVFTASGTYTKPAGINKIRVFVTGAGASGGMGTANYNAGGGGGAGATAIELIDVSSLSSTVAVTVGTGGASVSSTSTSGNSGGASSFGSYCTGGGGIQGANADQSGLSDCGTATGGDINIRGGDGGCAAGGNSNDERMVASGGSSYWGGGGKGAKPNTSQTGATNGQAGKAYGSGGGGGYYDGSNYASGAGKDGLVYIEEYK